MELPIAEIAQIARERNILVAVDGAQSMGIKTVNLRELGCDFYASSGHKWLMAPKGTGVFYAKESRQGLLQPLIVASGWKRISIRRFENYNTRNLPEVLGLGAALEYQNTITEKIKFERIQQLKTHFTERLQNNDEFVIKTPYAMSSGIVTVEKRERDVRKLAKELEDIHGINCRPMSSHNLNGLRISLSIFNTMKDVDYLVETLEMVG